MYSVCVFVQFFLVAFSYAFLLENFHSLVYLLGVIVVVDHPASSIQKRILCTFTFIKNLFSFKKSLFFKSFSVLTQLKDLSFRDQFLKAFLFAFITLFGGPSPSS